MTNIMKLDLVKQKQFKNGSVYCLKLNDGFLIETTDTFLPYYTKDAIGRHNNSLYNKNAGDRSERWMTGVSVMSGCPVHCKFCATGNMKKFRNLSTDEIVEQILFIVNNNKQNPRNSKEFKINYTRMGEPFLNLENLKKAIYKINRIIPNVHHYVSTIGIKNADYSWIKDNITLQISLHSLNEERRNWLIPFKNKETIKNLGLIRTQSKLKTTLNLSLVDESDFDINELKKYFNPDYFFIKLSPINENEFSIKNSLGKGVITSTNLI